MNITWMHTFLRSIFMFMLANHLPAQLLFLRWGINCVNLTRIYSSLLTFKHHVVKFFIKGIKVDIKEANRQYTEVQLEEAGSFLFALFVCLTCFLMTLLIIVLFSDSYTFPECFHETTEMYMHRKRELWLLFIRNIMCLQCCKI